MVDRQNVFINTQDVVSSILSVSLHKKLSIKEPWVLVNHVGTIILG